MWVRGFMLMLPSGPYVQCCFHAGSWQPAAPVWSLCWHPSRYKPPCLKCDQTAPHQTPCTHKNTQRKWCLARTHTHTREDLWIVHLQLHDQVIVCSTLIEILQSHHVLMLYPERVRKSVRYHCCLQRGVISPLNAQMLCYWLLEMGQTDFIRPLLWIWYRYSFIFTPSFQDFFSKGLFLLNLVDKFVKISITEYFTFAEAFHPPGRYWINIMITGQVMIKELFKMGPHSMPDALSAICTI